MDTSNLSTQLIELRAKYEALKRAADEISYDVGQVQYRFMRDEPWGRALFASYEKLKRALEA